MSGLRAGLQYPYPPLRPLDQWKGHDHGRA
jgi:hypothetical protein